MSWVFRGNINGSVLSEVQASPMVINNFTLVNKTASTVACNVYLISGSRVVSIAPFGGTINANGIYTSEIPRLLEANEQIKLATTGSVDYDFEIENTTAP